MLSVRHSLGSSSWRAAAANAVLASSSRTTVAPAVLLVTTRPYSNDTKSYPQYNIFSDKCMLSVKLLPPVFRYLKNSQTLILDNTKKGRLLLEWYPKNPDGTVSRDRNGVVRFGLSAEELGLLLRQIPLQQTVEFARQPTASESLHESTTSSPAHKVCKIIPLPDGHMVEWKVDFEVDGVGGQVMPNSSAGPMSVTMQAGEVQVVLEIMRTSLPLLVGWTPMQNVAVQKALNDAIQGGGNSKPEDPFGF